MKHFLYIILLSSVVLNVSAQNNMGRINSGNGLFVNNGGIFVNKKNKTKHKASPSAYENNVKQEEKEAAPYALYMNSVKQHGWMRGLGKPITDEHAKHLAHYFRFSKKNQAGHWTKVENLNGYGELENGNMGTYLVNPFDDEDLQIDMDWREKLKQIVRWELVGDISGEKCIQENAYDKDGNLVYSYIPVQVGYNKYMGHFVDAWGMPAQLRDEKEAKYVVVKWDDYGYESEVAYIGEDGYPKKNSWGAYIAKFVHDKDGFTISNMSCAADGSYMQDRSGNSGQRQICNEYGNSVIVTNYDENNEVVRINSDEDWIQYKIEYDKWGREEHRRYQQSDGSPDRTHYGVHGYDFKYNDFGKTTLIQRIGIDGNPTNDKDGISSIRLEYDEWGNQILFELCDANGHYINNKQDICMVTCKYEKDRLISQKYYQATPRTDTLLTYHFYRDGQKKINKYFLKNEIDVYIDDEHGNTIEELYYTLDWLPRNDEVKGYHHYAKKRYVANRVCKEEGFYFDTKGKLISLASETFRKHMLQENSDIYNHYIVKNDTANLVSNKQYFDGEHLLLHIQQQKSSDFKFPMREVGLDIMGKKARTHYEKALYYDAYTGRTIKDNVAYIGITNEYGEIAYCMESDASRSKAYAFRPLDGGKDLDEEGNEIIDPYKFRDKLPRAYVIEVYDSVATTKWGIKSGDIVMVYGGWEYPELKDYNYYGMDLREKAFLYKDINKEMVVMRRDAGTNDGEAITIPLGTGLPHDFGFFIHTILCTKKEASRYKDCYTREVEKRIKKGEYKESEGKGTIQFFSPLRSMGYTKNVFGRGVYDDAILLGLVMQDKKGVCYHATGDSLVKNLDKYRNSDDRSVQKLWFTTDLCSIKSLELFGSDSRWDAYFWYNSESDERLIKTCNKLYKSVDKEIQSFIQLLNKEYRDSMITAYGEAYNAVENDSVSIHLGRISGDTGYMVENGFKGLFVVLEWCGWKCTDKNSEFSNVFEKNRKKKKNILLLPVDSVDDQDVFGDIVRVKSNIPLLGLRMSEIKVSFAYFKKNILDRYRLDKIDVKI